MKGRNRICFRHPFSGATRISAEFLPWVAEPFSKCGATSACQNNYRKYFRFELATVTSQALINDVINFCQHGNSAK